MNPKKDVSLIIGIAIPILMIVLVAASIYLPSLFSAPPRFNFLYVIDDGYYQDREYVVERGTLVKQGVIYPERYTPRAARLFVHDVVKNEGKEISFEDAQRLPLDPSGKSPDGFEVVYGNREDGIFPLFLFSSTDYNTIYLKGHNASRKLDLPSKTAEGYYYSSRFRFLGWIK